MTRTASSSGEDCSVNRTSSPSGEDCSMTHLLQVSRVAVYRYEAKLASRWAEGEPSLIAMGLQRDCYGIAA